MQGCSSPVGTRTARGKPLASGAVLSASILRSTRQARLRLAGPLNAAQRLSQRVLVGARETPGFSEPQEQQALASVGLRIRERLAPTAVLAGGAGW